MKVYDRSPETPPRTAIGCGALIVLVILLGVFAMFTSPWTSTGGGEYGVIRNGGIFDNHEIRQVDGHAQVLPPGSALTWTGFASSVHRYPATQRNFVVSSAPTADSNEVIVVPSKDGVQLGIEGTFYFQLTSDPNLLGQFDDKFGVRTYPIPGKNDTALASEGDEGWNAFLSFTLGNLVQNDLRREVVQYRCTDLVASCSLAQNGAPAPGTVATVNTDQIAAIQDKVNTSFAADVASTLGGQYFTDIHFVLAKVAMDPKVQDAINSAQAAFAGVTSAQADLQKAQVEAQANAVKQQGYNTCPTCAEIDKLKALPSGITTYAPGGNVAVGAR